MRRRGRWVADIDGLDPIWQQCPHGTHETVSERPFFFVLLFWTVAVRVVWNLTLPDLVVWRGPRPRCLLVLLLRARVCTFFLLGVGSCRRSVPAAQPGGAVDGRGQVHEPGRLAARGHAALLGAPLQGESRQGRRRVRPALLIPVDSHSFPQLFPAMLPHRASPRAPRNTVAVYCLLALLAWPGARRTWSTCLTRS